MLDGLKRRLGLTFSLVLAVLGIMAASIFLGFVAFGILRWTGALGSFFSDHGALRGNLYVLVLLLAMLCVCIGAGLTALLSRKLLAPIRKVVEAMGEVAAGNFDKRIEFKGISELEDLSLSFNTMTAELSSIETLRSDFVDDFSHELKTPIASIKGYAKLLGKPSLSESKRSEYLDIIIDESERLSSLATNILNLSRYEHTAVIGNRSSFSLDEQIRTVLISLEPRWSAKGLSVRAELDEVLFDGNEDMLHQVWANLLDNAIKFSEPNGVVSVQLSAQEDTIVVRLEDTGIGMNEEARVRVFEKFFQSDDSRSQEGNGLGLAIVKRIVELHGGVISVRSEEGAGSVFTVTLPR